MTDQQTEKKKPKWILYLGLLISIGTYLYWRELKEILGFSVFYIGNALFIFLLCLYLFLNEKRSFINFVLLFLSLNNFFDEIFGMASNMNISEPIAAIVVVAIGYIRHKRMKRCKSKLIT